jgi:3-phosphoshikimate 1-carboxyvinyltransferase
MKNYSIYHPNGIIEGEITLPASKSLSNRALIIRALNANSFTIHNLSKANDTVLLEDALQKKNGEIDVQDAGTAFRFLTSYLSVTEGQFILTGSKRMKERPIGDLVDALKQLGAKIEYLENENKPPLKITGAKLQGGQVNIKSSISSQFISSLLMIAPKLKNGLKLKMVDDMVSKPYIEMTLKMLAYFGIQYSWDNNTIEIKKQEFQPKNIHIESDWSAVGFWLEIISLCKKGSIRLNGLQKNSWQGDCQTPMFFKPLGVNTYFKDGYLIANKEKYHSTTDSTIDLLELPDLSLSLISSYAFDNKPATFIGLQTLKNKESDRLNSLTTELKKCGVICSTDDSSLIIESFEDQNNTIRFKTYKDHRIAMSVACYALKDNIVMEDVDVVKKSYPSFWQDLEKVGFIINEEVGSNS